MAAPKINLYLDVVSPFAYIAYYVTRVCYNNPGALSYCNISKFSFLLSNIAYFNNL